MEGNRINIKEINEEKKEQHLGEIVATLHLLMRDFRSNNSKFDVDLGYLVHEPLKMVKTYFEYNERVDDYNYLHGVAKDTMAKLGNEFSKYKQLIHGDLQFANLMSSNGKYYFLDFEISGHGHPLYDIGCLFIFMKAFSSLKSVGMDEFFNRFFSGYSQKMDFEEDEFQLYKEFGKLRLIWNYKVWILAQNHIWPGQIRRLMNMAIDVLKSMDGE